MRKAAVILSCILIFTIFQNHGTFKDDISNRTVVQGVGIDINDDGLYFVTLETINTENYSASESAAKPVMNVRTFSGESVSSAIKSAYSATGKTPVMSQNRVILIGRKLAETGLAPMLDYFVRDAENYPSVLLATTENSAEEFLKSASDETRVISRDVENIIRTSDIDATVSGITICELMNRYKSVGNAFYMPIMSTQKNGDKTEVISKGTTVFKDGKSVCTLTESETASLNFVCGNVKKGTVDFSVDGKKCAVSIINCRAERNVNFDGENPVFTVSLKIKADLAETELENLNKLSGEDIENIEKNAEDKIKSDIENLCTELYKGVNADAAGLSRLVYIKYPEVFRENEKNLNEIMTNSRYFVKVDVSVRRTGQSYSSF